MLQMTRRPFLASLSAFIAVAEVLAIIVSSLFIGLFVLRSITLGKFVVRRSRFRLLR